MPTPTGGEFAAERRLPQAERCSTAVAMLRCDYARHSDLLVAVARAMGQDIHQFGQGSSGPLPGDLAG